MQEPLTFFWFRRDLRLDDNAALFHALKGNFPVNPVFIFDKMILDNIDEVFDHRVHFIHQSLQSLNDTLNEYGTSLLVEYGSPEEIWKKWIEDYNIHEVYTNHDYEPYARERDQKIKKLLDANNIDFYTFKDQVIFEKNEVVKKDAKPYTVFTPYAKQWHNKLDESYLRSYQVKKYTDNFRSNEQLYTIPDLEDMGFKPSSIIFPPRKVDKSLIENYHNTRNIPGINGTSRLSVHLRFGTISIRKLAKRAFEVNKTYLNELIWREFFMMILYHFPKVVEHSFKPEYDKINWRNSEEEFERWCNGKTGYPIVDAGMRELNTTGYMHNRLRMITASFLTKDLLIDWRWGEAYFGKKLLDYELSSNNGGWQWAAGSGCDAAPYFRIFNPSRQQERFDNDRQYIKKWIPELNTSNYPEPIVDHAFARKRALETYKKALEKS